MKPATHSPLTTLVPGILLAGMPVTTKTDAAVVRNSEVTAVALVETLQPPADFLFSHDIHGSATVTMGPMATTADAKPATATEIVVPAPAEPVKVTAKERKKFQSLAVKEALGTATAEDMEELTRLDRVMNRDPGAMTADELLAEYRQQQMALEAAEFFRRYATVLKR